ncbi:hypothetical protein V8B97DRAFT_1915669 [Scleroderma yunnanense]
MSPSSHSLSHCLSFLSTIQIQAFSIHHLFSSQPLVSTASKCATSTDLHKIALRNVPPQPPPDKGPVRYCYGHTVDWWAFGVLTYGMFSQLPFYKYNEDRTFDAILEDKPLYPITTSRNAVSILQKNSVANTSNFNEEFTREQPTLTTVLEFAGFSWVAFLVDIY